MSSSFTVDDFCLADPLSLPMVDRAIAAALLYAQEKGLQVSVAVVDVGGHLLGFSRIPGASLHSIDIAQDKAWTAVSFSMPTCALANLMRHADEHVRQCLISRPRMVPMGGAFPLMLGARLLGAIGVSGASEEQDVGCATAGYDAIRSAEAP
jgi:glc operon protein GlcG